MIIYIQRFFAEYRLACYSTLNKRIGLRVLHTGYVGGIKQAKTAFSENVRYIKIGKGESGFFLFSLQPILRLSASVIIHEFAIGIVSLPLVLLFSKVFRRKVILYSHGYNRKVGFDPVHSIKDKYRLWLMNAADALLVYCKEDKQFLSGLISPEKIFVAQNTVDTDALIPIRNELRVQTRERVRQKLEWSENSAHIIYVGRLYKAKLVHLLVESAREIIDKGASIKLHVVGDGPECQNLRSLTRELHLEHYISFYGSITDDQLLGKMLFASDLMVMPGAVGLSVNHAFCFDCPVLTLRSANHVPAHGPEINYIVHKETGLLVDSHTSESITSSILEYLNDPELQSRMRSKISEKIDSELTTEQMVAGIMSAIKYVQSDVNTADKA